MSASPFAQPDLEALQRSLQPLQLAESALVDYWLALALAVCALVPLRKMQAHWWQELLASLSVVTWSLLFSSNLIRNFDTATPVVVHARFALYSFLALAGVCALACWSPICRSDRQWKWWRMSVTLSVITVVIDWAFLTLCMVPILELG